MLDTLAGVESPMSSLQQAAATYCAIISPERVINIAAVLDPQGTAKALEEQRAADAAEAASSRRRVGQGWFIGGFLQVMVTE